MDTVVAFEPGTFCDAIKYLIHIQDSKMPCPVFLIRVRYDPSGDRIRFPDTDDWVFGTVASPPVQAY